MPLQPAAAFASADAAAIALRSSLALVIPATASAHRLDVRPARPGNGI
jgi:hypothetical protein